MVDAGVMKLVTMRDSKSRAFGFVGSSPTSSTIMLYTGNRLITAYVIGLAIGDGNLSNPNGRAVRLRITCDIKYPRLIRRIEKAIKIVAPNNSVKVVNKTTPSAVDVSCYSNDWEKLLGWKAKGGPKHEQDISIPQWIKDDTDCAISCLKGLIETDGCIYKDRGYTMVNFVTILPRVASDVNKMINKLGFIPNTQSFKHPIKRYKLKYTVRISRNTESFIKLIGMNKS